MLLDTQIAELAAAAADANLTPIHELTPIQARARSRAGGVNARPGPSDLTVTESIFHGVPIRTYRPDVPASHIIYAHGGGWVTGDLDTMDGFCRRMASEAGSLVTSVDYRLAPEHPYPAALDDYWTIVQNVHGIRTAEDQPLILAGDSAGATLAAIAARRARDVGSPHVSAQILLYPVTDRVTMDRASYREHQNGFPIGEKAMTWFWNHYLAGHETDWSDPDIAPLATMVMSGLPPALVVLAGHDPLRDEGLEYANSLAHAGVPVRILNFDSLCHGFCRLDAVVTAANEANDFVIDIISGLPQSIIEEATT